MQIISANKVPNIRYKGAGTKMHRCLFGKAILLFFLEIFLFCNLKTRLVEVEDMKYTCILTIGKTTGRYFKKRDSRLEEH